MPPLGFGAFLDEGETTPQPNQRNSPNMTNKTAKPGLINLGPADYSKEEIAVLRKTSFINSREYVPFMSVDMKERFAFPVQYRYLLYKFTYYLCYLHSMIYKHLDHFVLCLYNKLPFYCSSPLIVLLI